VKKSYHKSTLGKIDSDLRSGLLTAILNFAESAISKDFVEYFQGKKYLIAFKKNMIKADDSFEPELLISYAIMDKEKRVEKYAQKIVQPLLTLVGQEFISKNSGKNLSEITQFKYFKKNLDRIFGSDTMNIDQKFEGILY
jgi:hypothetical protein